MSIKYRKTKGKVLENKVQNILREYFNVDDRIIKRNVSSGTQSGEISDINIIDQNIEEKFPYIIECKNQEIWNIRDLIGNNINKKSNPFIKYWNQIEREIKNYNKKYKNKKYGLLIFSKQNYPIYVMVKYNELNIKVLSKLNDYNHIITNINKVKYVVFEINDFLNIIEQNEK